MDRNHECFSHPESAICLRNVWKIFGPAAGKALESARKLGTDKAELLEKYNCILGVTDVSLDIFPGEIFCIMGLSGSGKSTLVRHLNRLIEPTAGEIIILGRNLADITNRELRDLRARHIGMVFQHMALFPHLSVRDNVAFPLEVQGESKTRRWQISQDVLSLVNLDNFEDRMPHELSGGMRQRVGLARALASDPKILLMDEPFSALDPLIRRQLQGLFLDISRRLKKTTVFITHDLEEAASIGDRIAIMKDGRVVQIGTPEDIIMNPINDYVAEFVRNISKLKIVRARTIMRDIEHQDGDIPKSAPRIDGGMGMNELVALATSQPAPIIVADAGRDIGIITRKMLLNFMEKEAE